MAQVDEDSWKWKVVHYSSYYVAQVRCSCDICLRLWESLPTQYSEEEENVGASRTLHFVLIDLKCQVYDSNLLVTLILVQFCLFCCF